MAMTMRLFLVCSCAMLSRATQAPSAMIGSLGQGPQDPGVGKWQVVKPESVGLHLADLEAAKDFINENVLDRQCFILIKDGKIAYEWYNPKAPDPPNSPKWTGQPEGKPHRGWSMTKTVGGFLTLLAATEHGLDIDADITKQYAIPSPKPYPVTLRMMMSQTIGGDHRPGEIWRYDEMGDMWLHLFPKVILAATNHTASYYLNRMHSKLGLSAQFSWSTVDSEWSRGASGSCRDWARFGQLILNQGAWGGEQLIDAKYIRQMQEPVKHAPYNEYSNPCYGLLLWVNADKAKHPGCCWEASRLPDPKCNDETFMTGAVHDLTLNIGLYGQLVMTLASVNTVVVGFGRDLRPIEPARIGYYPGICKMLGLPCNDPPKVPATKCGELLQCTGMAAQCFGGGGWSHQEPTPGKDQCVSCFQNRLPIFNSKFPETHEMIKNWCPSDHQKSFEYVRCFCGLTGENANPFAPWPTTTTTTLPLSPAPPLPPPSPTPAPPAPGPACQLTDRCIHGLEAKYKCYNINRNGGHDCYKGIKLWQKQLTANYGCPQFMSDAEPIYESKAFCWCGLDNSPPSRSLSRALTPSLQTVFQGQVQGGLCNNGWDTKMLQRKPKWLLQRDTFVCGQKVDGDQHKGAACMRNWEHITAPCAHCFGMAIACSNHHCQEQCACSPKPPGESRNCHYCVQFHCQKLLDWCTGLPSSASSGSYEALVDLNSTRFESFIAV